MVAEKIKSIFFLFKTPKKNLRTELIKQIFCTTIKYEKKMNNTGLHSETFYNYT
jgi:hypothetical protein